MKINSISQIYSNTLPQLSSSKSSKKNGSIHFNNGKLNTVTFSGSLFKDIFNKNKAVNNKEQTSYIPTPYIAEMTEGLNKFTGENFKPVNLKNIMSPSEILTDLKSLSAENFIFSKQNIEKGIYRADLDYQTSYSNEKENVLDLLEEVADYADKYHEQTGNSFIFAITDKDTLEGVQHAVRIIASDPERYKNVKFIPGIKMSFAHEASTSKTGYESSDMLVYGINPFSENLINFVENTITKRKNMLINFIKKVNQLYPEFAYNIIEFAQQNQIKYKKGFTVSNLYWRAREYAETKGDTTIKGITMPPKEIVKEAESIINNLSKLNLGSDEKGYSALGTNIIKGEEVNPSIKKVFDEYSTHFDEDRQKVVSSDDNSYEDMINCLNKEDEKPVLALCDTYYFTQYFNKENNDYLKDLLSFFNKLKDNSKGMLSAFESVAPAYERDLTLNQKTLKDFNKFIRENTKLYEVGGSFAKRYEVLFPGG